jgi:hypothetical protein
MAETMILVPQNPDQNAVANFLVGDDAIPDTVSAWAGATF